MSKIPMALIAKDYDHLAPLACGDVAAEGIDLTLIRDNEGSLARFLDDAAIEAGELSFSRYLIRLAEGDRRFVGIPVFPIRAFRHRCFFVRRGSGYRGLKDLDGKRVGTNEWPATGNTWSRAILRRDGVPLDRIRWWVGSVDG